MKLTVKEDSLILTPESNIQRDYLQRILKKLLKQVYSDVIEYRPDDDSVIIIFDTSYWDN